jgi:microcystin-dependent protein
MPDITKGKTFTSGETVTASEMNSLVDDAVINSSAITESKIAAGAVTNAKIASSAGIGLNKLASGTDGQIPICSATGVPTYVTLTGATVTNAGVVSLDAGVVTSSMLAAPIPTGAVIPYAGTSAPTGWLVCDGTEKNSVSDTTLADLYTAIGIRYGGSSASAFNLPDMRGRVAVAADGAAARMASNDAAGESGGEELHTLTVAEMPAHAHDVNTGTANNNAGGVAGNAPKGSDLGSPTVSAYTDGALTKGGDTAFNNMQPYQVVDNYIIKT